MTTIHEHIGFMDRDSLRKETGLSSPDLFFALESLATEQKISINIGHPKTGHWVFVKDIQ